MGPEMPMLQRSTLSRGTGITDILVSQERGGRTGGAREGYGWSSHVGALRSRWFPGVMVEAGRKTSGTVVRLSDYGIDCESNCLECQEL